MSQRKELQKNNVLLADMVQLYMENIIFSEISAKGLKEEEKKKQINRRSRLRRAVRECSLGGIGERIYVLEFMKEYLVKTAVADPELLEEVIPFSCAERLSSLDKWEIIQYLFSQKYGKDWLSILVFEVENMRYKEFGIAREKIDVYEISENDLERLFISHISVLTVAQKVDITAQRIYEKLYGFSVCDVLISNETAVDGVAAGCGGKKDNSIHVSDEVYGHDTIFVMLAGKKIRLSFLKFQTESELSSLVRKLSRNSNQEQLSRRVSYLVTNLKSNARVVVYRPPVSDGWGFYVRKFQTTKPKQLEELLADEQKEIAISFLRTLVKGNRNIMITGEQASGKTTLLKSLVGFIHPQYSLRVAESVLESRLNELYPYRNIHAMQEFGDVNLSDVISFFKKTDTDVTICGEINDPETAVSMIQIAQSGGRFTMSTSHHGTTVKLIHYFRNALLQKGGFSDEQIATEQVVEVLRFDIHMAMSRDGHRYIERVTEIEPDKEKGFRLRELLLWNNGEYQLKEPISEKEMCSIRENYPGWEKEMIAGYLRRS